MNECLLCTQKISYPINIKSLFFQRFHAPILCQNCLKTEQLAQLAYENFLEKRDYRWYRYFAIEHAKTLRKWSKFSIIAYPPLDKFEQKLPNYTLKILKEIGLKGYDMTDDLGDTKSICVYFNGICQEDRDIIRRKCDKCIALWSVENGKV